MEHQKRTNHYLESSRWFEEAGKILILTAANTMKPLETVTTKIMELAAGTEQTAGQ